MRWNRNHIGLLALVGGLVLTGPALAQRPPMPGDKQPQLQIVMPSGGKVGSTVELAVTGQELDDLRACCSANPVSRRSW